MQIHSLTIKNFRGIKSGKVIFKNHCVIIGQNNSGKTTIIEALALLLGRDNLVRSLTEHDFYKSNPSPTDRIEIIATITDFVSNQIEANSDWFRYDRAVPKWLNELNGELSSIKTDEHSKLACQIAYVSRFDKDSLEFESVRYFYDTEAQIDPFDENLIVTVQGKLLREIGFFLVPANRAWDKIISFGSELFRKLIAESSALPADSIIEERDRVRMSSPSLDEDSRLRPVIQEINNEINAFFPDGEKLKLRITETDSKGVLDAVIPHFGGDEGIAIPSRRQGSGLISLQRLFLLLHFGHSRIESNKGFFLALEEPELHLQPSVQRRLLHRLQALSSQTIITTHSPLIAAFTEPTSLIILIKDVDGVLRSIPLLDKPLDAQCPNAIRKLFQMSRIETVSALMHELVLIPEGRTDYDWLTLIQKAVELKQDVAEADSLNAGARIGIIPTHDAAVEVTFKSLHLRHPKIGVLVDGDSDGKLYARNISNLSPRPTSILMWPEDWTIEDIIGWIATSDESNNFIESINTTISDVTTVDSLVQKIKTKTNNGGLKGDLVSYESIVDALAENPVCLRRMRKLLNCIAERIMGIGSEAFSESTQPETSGTYTFVP